MPKTKNLIIFMNGFVVAVPEELDEESPEGMKVVSDTVTEYLKNNADSVGYETENEDEEE